MGKAIEIARLDRSSASLRAIASKARDGGQVPPASGIALLLDGASRREAATASGMDRQTVCDWVHRYDAGGVAGLASRTGPGRPAGVEFIAQLWEIDENLARSELTPSQIASIWRNARRSGLEKKTAESGGTSPTLIGSSRRTAAAPACA